MLKRIRRIVPILFWIGIWTMNISVEASYGKIPNVSFSPDGNAFTTNAGERNTQWYEAGYTVHTGVRSTLREPKEGEHVYSYIRSGKVPVGKCVVYHKYAACVHNVYPQGNLYYGMTFGRQRCSKAYYSGWFAYCADCAEQLLPCYMYMSADTAKHLTYIDMSKAYYYKCPHCDNLEQGSAPVVHICQGISANQYSVRYHANLGSGFMEPSRHMVNNATSYEGEALNPQKRLNPNAFKRDGYEFAGWNTKRDGSGLHFADEAEIYNLTMEENKTIILYAQWQKESSVLEIDPQGGSYDQKEGITRIRGYHNSQYNIQISKLKCPSAYQVSFDTNGGEKIDSVWGERIFYEWERSSPFHGKLEGQVYSFGGKSGMVDRLTAIYEQVPVILPEAFREGYSFGGWFLDEACTKPVGMPGTEYIPIEDVTLYASWVDLQLVAVDNYTANHGRGAVNLFWNQKDEKNKLYQVFQKTKRGEWKTVKTPSQYIKGSSLNDVEAPDMEPPQRIGVEEVQKTWIEEGTIRIAFRQPKDEGTDYYHMVKSYSEENKEWLCTSNQTVNTLTSGMAGYYYTVNEKPVFMVDNKYNFYAERGEHPFLTLRTTENNTYLHIAPVDQAGNIGPTTHILLSAEDALAGPLLTMPLICQEGGNVCPAKAQATYYVRADGVSEAVVRLEGLLCGSARADYQINRADFLIKNLSVGTTEGTLTIQVPNERVVLVGTRTYPAFLLQRTLTGISDIQNTAYTTAKRTNRYKSLEVVQGLWISPNSDGHVFRLTPQVAIMGEKKMITSDAGEDLKNSLFLIADGKAPKITGADSLTNKEFIDYSKEEISTVMLTATDTGCGLAEFYVEIVNVDNHAVVRYTDTSLSGKISINISKENPVFQGAFQVVIYAVDKVGNETLIHNTVLGIGLEAYVTRVLTPHEPQFKRGESGILHIKTLGYIEEVKIEFPTELKQEPLPEQIVYSVPVYQKKEEIPIVIPLDMPEGEITLKVTAYKSGVQISDTPRMITIKVEGSILDELRTRLR